MQSTRTITFAFILFELIPFELIQDILIKHHKYQSTYVLCEEPQLLHINCLGYFLWNFVSQNHDLSVMCRAYIYIFIKLHININHQSFFLVVLSFKFYDSKNSFRISECQTGHKVCQTVCKGSSRRQQSPLRIGVPFKQ